MSADAIRALLGGGALWSTDYSLTATATQVSTAIEAPAAAITGVNPEPRDWCVYVAPNSLAPANIPYFATLSDRLNAALRIDTQVHAPGTGTDPTLGFQFIRSTGACLRIAGGRTTFQLATTTKAGGLGGGSPTTFDGVMWVAQGNPSFSYVPFGEDVAAAGNFAPLVPNFWTGRYRIESNAASIDVNYGDGLGVQYTYLAAFAAGVGTPHWFVAPPGATQVQVVNNDGAARQCVLTYEVYR